MAEKTRTRNVQKEALYEVLQESSKDKKLQNIDLETLHKLAIDLEEQAFRTSNQEINKDYRLRINTIKVRLKGEKGQILRKVLIENLLNPNQLMKMDMNTLNEETIIQYLKSQGINLQKEETQQKPLPQNKQKHAIPPINTQQKKQFQENQQNQCEGLSEIKTNNEQVIETPAQHDGQGGDMMESQAQIKFLLEELDKKQFNQQIENKEDEIEQYEEILNTPKNFDQGHKSQQNIYNQKQQLAQQQGRENQRSIDPSPEDDKLNQDIIQDDIDISQSKLCKSLLRNIEEKPYQNDDLDQINALYNEINKLRQQYKELQIQNQHLSQQILLNKQQAAKELERTKTIFENEISQLKSQLQLAKNFKEFDFSSQITLSFQQRQNALQDQINQFISEFNQKFNQKKITTIQESQLPQNIQQENQIENQETIIENILLQETKSTPQDLSEHEQKLQFQESLLPEQKVVELQEANFMYNNVETKQEVKNDIKTAPPPPQVKRVVKPPPQNSAAQVQNEKRLIETSQQQIQENQTNQMNINAEDFFNQLSINQQQDPFNPSIQQPIVQEEQGLHQNEIKQFQQQPFQQAQRQDVIKPQKQPPKQRRVAQGKNGVQNVPSSLFD